ncbi:MAG TPA: ThuA domain-containing protein [Chloroflexota bacterium]|nr:ThuA domain-containing protein [Chloroflexota bacterium]
MKTALIVQGGWPGHRPQQVAEILAAQLKANAFSVEVADSLERLVTGAGGVDLLVLNWHGGTPMQEQLSALLATRGTPAQERAALLEAGDRLQWGTVTQPQLAALLAAVKGGVGLAGMHAGMGDAFRNEVEYQFMIGGQWVAHPGDDGVSYEVRIVDRQHPITAGVEDFTVVSEQYYMHIDPAIHTLATTQFGDLAMPVAWTTRYGAGNVFYSSLGHTPDIVRLPGALALMTQGMVWAAR